MLLSLYIQNAALIKEQKIEFCKNLNILSGETGSGKSIVIDCLSFVLGELSDKTMVRNGESRMLVEAVFDITANLKVLQMLKDIGIEDGNDLIINRSITAEGRSENRINSRAVTLSVLKKLSAELVDIHNQSEHNTLLRSNSQLEILDATNNEIIKQRGTVDELYSQYKQVVKKLAEYGSDDTQRERLIDLYKYQIEEIKEANIQEGEEDDLMQKRARVINMEKILNALSSARTNLSKGSVNILDMVSAVIQSINSISATEKQLERPLECLKSIQYDLKDIDVVINDTLDELDYSAINADEIENRLEKIKKIKKKYGATVDQINAFADDAQLKYNFLTCSAKNIEDLEIQKKEVLDKLYQNSVVLTQLRQKQAVSFESGVLKHLADLGMTKCKFEIRFKPYNQNDTEKLADGKGMDKIDFYFSANVGQPVQLLSKIISGGEMSRFMLAIKNVCMYGESTLMVFDEIDAGISGETAQMVAKKLANISRNHQCIAVTHLPQIASMGDNNYVISKRQHEASTITEITLLGQDGKIDEIARLIGGKKLGPNSTAYAQDILKWSSDYKNQLTK